MAQPRTTYKKLIMGLALCATALGIAAAPASALSVSSPTDCDDNAVLRCGALSTQSLISKYGSQSGAAAIYAYFGISRADVMAMNSSAVAGSVTKSGDVLVGGKVVATNAMTAGRQNMSGSTKVTSNGVTFYKRAPSASFQSSSLPAFVVMHSGAFAYAIIASCGNPVTAKAVAAPAPKPTPAPTKPTPTPSKPAPTPAAPAATVTAAPAAQTAPAPASLPNTGAGDVVGLGASALVAGAVGYQLYLRRKFAHHA